MKASFHRYIIIGQLGLLVSLLLSLFLSPDVYRGPGGFSNYGVQAETTALYSIGFLIVGGLTYKAATLLRDDTLEQKLTRTGLASLAFGYILVLISTYPYQLNETLDTIHRQIGALFFVYINIFTAWLVNNFTREPIGVLLLFAVIGGSLIAMLSIHEFVPLLSHGQAITALSFSLLLSLSALRIPKHYFKETR